MRTERDPRLSSAQARHKQALSPPPPPSVTPPPPMEHARAWAQVRHTQTLESPGSFRILISGLRCLLRCYCHPPPERDPPPQRLLLHQPRLLDCRLKAAAAARSPPQSRLMLGVLGGLPSPLPTEDGAFRWRNLRRLAAVACCILPPC
jgi:hypothetical protein